MITIRINWLIFHQMSSIKTPSQQAFLSQGQHQQLHQLYDEHHTWLLSWLSKKLGCPEQAADLSQDTFVKLLKRQYPLELKTPRAYLTTVANHLVVNHWRRREVEKNYLETIAALPETEVPSIENQMILIETLTQIDHALSSLPGRVREAFLLSQLHGLTYKVIAQRLQVSERTVKNYMSKAMMHCLLITESVE